MENKLERAAYISDYVMVKKLDSVGITETWLHSDDTDNVATLSALIPSTYKMSHIQRQGSLGGVVTFMHKDHYRWELTTAIKHHPLK